MSSVDERIVKMVFDNGEFMTKIAGTISSLTQLNKATDEVANNSGSGISAIGKAFEQAEVMSTQAGFHIRDVWTKVTNILEDQIAGKIVKIGKDIANAMSFEGISDGFKEYELKMGSVQTIMAGTGESLQTVNKYLEELNKYSDQTIYSFADMTNNIGKFTNAGVKLEDAVAAIKGIANEAAISGANANEASRAMYNFSQALSAGYVKLIDWKSIENANMATKGFKDTLLEVASAVGTVEKQEDGMYKILTKNANGGEMKELVSGTKNFNDSLAQQWMTTEVLTKALKIYATDVRSLSAEEKKAYEEELKAMGLSAEQIKQFEELGSKATDAASEIKTFSMMIDTLKEAIGSGWAMTWELLIGDFEEAKALWTEVGGVLGGIIDKTSETRNNLIKGWKSLGGRKDLIDGLRNSFEFLYKVLQPIGWAMKEVFPPTTRAQLYKITHGFKEFSETLKATTAITTRVKSIAKGFFSIFDIGLKFVKAFVNAIFPASKGLGDLGWNLFDAAAKFGDFLSGLDESITKGKVFEKVFETIGNVVKPIFDFILSGAKGATKLLGDFFGSFTDSAGSMSSAGDVMKKVFDNISNGITNVKGKIEKLHPIFEGLSSIFKGIGKLLGSAFKQIGDAISGFAVGGNGIGGIMNIFNAFMSGGIMFSVFKGIKSFSSIGESFTGVLDGLGDALKRFGGNVGGDDTLLNAAKAIAILAGSLLVVAMIDDDKLAGATMAITGLMFGLAAAIGVLMKAINSFSTSDIKRSFSIFGKELFGTSATKMIEMAVTLQSVSKALLAMGGAVLMMSVGLKIVASVAKDGNLWESFAVISLMLAELTGVAIVLGKWGGDANTGAKNLKGMCTALILMAAALKIVSNVVASGNGWESLAILSIMLGELTGIVVILDHFTDYKMSSMLPLISLAISLNLVVIALKSVSDALGTEGNRIWEALGVISIILAELTGVVLLMGNFGGFAALGGVGAILAATALLILVQALKQISDALGQTDQHVWQALGVIAASLGVLAVGLTLMAGTIPGSAGLLIASAALVVLAGALKIMATMSLGEIGKGLLTIAGSLIILAAGLTGMILALPGALSLTVAAFGLTVLAGALKLFASMSLEEIGKSLLMLTTAMAGIAIASTVFSLVSPLIVIFSIALAAFGAALIATSFGMTMFAAGLQALVAVIPMGAQAITFLGEALASLIPIIAGALMDALITIASKIVAAGPVIITAVIAIIDMILIAIETSTVKIAQTFYNVILGIINVITENIPVIAAAGADLIIAFIDAISEQELRIIDAAYKCAISFINGLADTIENNNGDLIAAVDHLMSAVIQAITQWLVEFTPLGLLIPEEMKDGIMSGEFNVKDALDDIVRNAVEGLKGKVQDFIDAGKDFIGGFISGLKDIPLIGNVVSAAADLGSKAVEALRSKKGIDSHSDAKETIKAGKDFDGGLATGIEDNAYLATDAAEALGADSVEALQGSLEDGMPDLETTVEEMSNVVGDGLGGSVDSLKQTIKDAIPVNIDYKESVNNVTEAHKENTKEVDKAAQIQKDLSTETARSNHVAEKNTVSYEYNTKAMKNNIDKKLTLNEIQEHSNKGTITYNKTIKKNTELVKENTNAQNANAEATGKSGTATKKSADVMEYASGVVDAFNKKYGDLYKELGDDAPMKVAQFAVRKLAEETYKASVAAENATEKNKKTKASIEDMIKAFTDMKEKLYDSVKSYFEGDKFFQKFEVKAEMSMSSLLENMKSNIDGVTNWANTLASLADKGVSQGLLKRLGELGPQGFEYVNAFASATTDQIQQANQMFEQAAVLPDSLSNDVLASYAKAGLNVVQGFANGIDENTQAAVDAMSNANVSTYKELTDFWIINSPSEKTYEAGCYLVQGLENAIMNNTPIVVNDATIMSERIYETISENLDKQIFYSMGENIAYGLADGMSSEAAVNAVREAAARLSEIAASVTESFNLISSPSKRYYGYGDYIAQGLANGMEDGVDYVESSATTLSESVKNTMGMIRSIVDDEVDLSPVISPVLDLSGLRGKAGQIQGLFPHQSLAMASSIGIGSNSATVNGVPVAGTTQINYTQNNYSPKALSRIEIYRQTKNQISMIKGVKTSNA